MAASDTAHAATERGSRLRWARRRCSRAALAPSAELLKLAQVNCAGFSCCSAGS